MKCICSSDVILNSLCSDNSYSVITSYAKFKSLISLAQ